MTCSEPAMLIHVIVPLHNRVSMTGISFASLRMQSDQGFRVVVVDDGSTIRRVRSSTASFLRSAAGGDGNLWWVGSINLGLERTPEQCPDDYVLLLNNDLVIPRDFMATMRS